MKATVNLTALRRRKSLLKSHWISDQQARRSHAPRMTLISGQIQYNVKAKPRWPVRECEDAA